MSSKKISKTGKNRNSKLTKRKKQKSNKEGLNKLDSKTIEYSKKVSDLLEEQFGKVSDNILKLASKFMNVNTMDLGAYLNIAVKAWNYSIYREAGINDDRGNELVEILKATIDSEKLLDNIYKEKLKISKWDSRLVLDYSFDNKNNSFSAKSHHKKDILDGIKNLREKEEIEIIKYQEMIFQSDKFEFSENHLVNLYNLYDANPKNPLIIMMLAEMLSQSYNVNIENSIKYFEEAANIMIDDVYPHIRIMECYKSLNMDDKSDEKYNFIKEFVEKYPDDSNLLL